MQPKLVIALQLVIILLRNACSILSSSSSSLAFHQMAKRCTGSFGDYGGMTTVRKRSNTSSMNPNPFVLSMAQDEKDYTSPMRQRPRPEGGDVAYTNENILRQLRYYNNIRQVGGDDCIMDVYARDPNLASAASTTLINVDDGKDKNVRYWFVGKVARCTGTVSPEFAIARQYNLLEEHACRIRPIELGRCFGHVELFMAPGNTEVLLSTNDPTILLQKVPRYIEGVEQVALLEIGLNLEIVTNQGAGFCIYRDD